MRTLLALAIATTTLSGQVKVTSDRLRDALKEPESWLTYSGDYSGRRFSGLDQIRKTNVHLLRPAWIYQLERGGPLKSSPLVFDGVMFLTELPQTVTALDPATGRVLWRYRHQVPAGHRVHWPTRGVAAGGGLLFYGTHDARLLAIDAGSGVLRWSRAVADYKIGYAISAAPLVIGDRVLVGATGGENGVRGFLDAYAIKDGTRLWRFWTVPGPGEPGHETWSGNSWQTGGAPAWLTGTFDPELNLTYWGTGNPAPPLNGDARRGDNLYSDSLLAIDVETGRLKWHFQFTPHDLWDYDACQIPVLIDAPIDGRMRKLVLTANKNAFFYALDRVTGELLVAREFAPQTWATGLDARGRPVVAPQAIPTPRWTTVKPSDGGATNWKSPTYSPLTGLFYVAIRDAAGVFRKIEQTFVPGESFWGGTASLAGSGREHMAVRALRPDNGRLQWEFPVSSDLSGLMSTRGGLVFGGTREGNAFAVDADSGKPLWHFQAGGAINGNPISYALRGTQYVVMGSGGNVVSFSLPASAGTRTAAK